MFPVTAFMLPRPAHFQRLCLPMAALVLALAFAPAPSMADDPSADPESRLLTGIENLVQDLQTATWSQEVWMSNGKDEEHTVADVWWSAGGPIRVDVTDGDNKGGTAVLKDEKVRGFRRGLLSFARLSFDVDDKRVKSVRGQSMKVTGFVDDLQRVLAQKDQRTIQVSDDKAVIDYRNEHDLPARMWLRLPELHPYRIEVREEGRLVEKHEFFDISYQADIDPDVFDI